MGRILYFVQGVPSDADMAQAKKAGALIRNACAWHNGDFLEDCEAVMGNPDIVPEPYKAKLKQKKVKKEASNEPDC